MDEKKSKLLDLIKSRVIHSDVILSSGKKSNYYVDGKYVSLSSEGAYLIGNIFFDLLKNKNIDAVGGLEMGAVPICGAIAAISYLKGHPIQTFVVRKNPREHGLKKEIEGPVKKGDRVIIVEDVTTTGQSVLKTIEKCQKNGLIVLGVIVLFDRLEGAKERVEEKGIKFESIFSKADLQ